MKANKIQIGDWVYSTFSKLPCKVTYLKLHESGYASVETTNVVGVKDIASLSPIPLTPEILEKNGFEWTTRKSYMVSCIGTVRMIWGFYKDCLSISDNSDDGGCQISSLKCKFVHQLQHALRLCGIEKEIIL